jgi:hypothetical protein
VPTVKVAQSLDSEITLGTDDDGHGVGYRVTWDPRYKEAFAREANQLTAFLMCRAIHAGEVKARLMDAADYTPGQRHFDRTLPLSPPGFNRQYLLRMDSDKFLPDAPVPLYRNEDGSGNPVEDAAGQSLYGVGPDPDQGKWPHLDEITYQLTFGNVPYDVKANGDVSAAAVPELQRYVTKKRRFLPEARKVPTAGFEAYNPDNAGERATVVQEVGFIPTYQIELTYQAEHWPRAAYPEAAIAKAVGRVNAATFDGKYPPGTLLYKGPANEVVPYIGPDGEWYLTIAHLFGYRPEVAAPSPGERTGGGWNNQLVTRSGAAVWRPLRVRGISGNTPMFAPGDFDALFLPPATPFDW